MRIPAKILPFQDSAGTDFPNGHTTMRIMLVHAPSPIVRELCRRGYEVLSSNSTKSFDTHDDLPGAWGPRQRSVNFPGRKKVNLSAIRRVAKLARDFRPEILHAFSPTGLAWAVLGTTGMASRPKILSFRGIPRGLRHTDPSEWISYLSPRVAMHACESLAVMESMVRSGIPTQRCRVIYNTMWEFEDRKSRSEWRSEWGVDPDTFLIGSVGHIRPIKGFDLLLRAAQSMHESPGWKIALCGPVDDPYVQQLASSDLLRERVLLLGPMRHAASALKAMDLFVMPSRSEGLCRALIEAMMMGVCPVVSDAGGMKELVRHGRDGLVFPCEDVGALEQAIRKLMGDARERSAMSRSATEHVRALCSTGVVVDKLLGMYETALAHESWGKLFEI